MRWESEWRPYVSVAEKRRQAVQKAAQHAKKQGRAAEPVVLKSRKIATTFWGRAWCDNLTSYQDYSNRLPRGATYVRNGSVVDLLIHSGRIEAIVAGSEPYTIRIEIQQLDQKRWKAIRQECSQSIDSLLDLLSGKLSDGVMHRLTDRKTGLFPSPGEIRMSCSCPDYSSCCKHLAAVMYGVGAKLDNQPELLFLLRGVDHQELISHAISSGNIDRELNVADSTLQTQDLGAIFGIELDTGAFGKTDAKVDAKPKKQRARKARADRDIPEESRAAASQIARAADPLTSGKKAVSPSRITPSVKKASVKKSSAKKASAKKASAKKAASAKEAATGKSRRGQQAVEKSLKSEWVTSKQSASKQSARKQGKRRQVAAE